MSDPRAVIVVPWRPGQSHRERNWRWAREWWQQFGWEIFQVEQRGREPFNRSWCINEGARRAWPWDVLVAIDADVFEADPQQVRDGVASCWETGRLTIPHTRGNDLNEHGVRALLEGRDDWARFLSGHRDVCTSRVTIVREDLFEQVGGFDERFRGWGWEDVAFFNCARSLRGCDHLPGTSWHLWHPEAFAKAKGTVEFKEGRALCDRYLAADQNGWPALEPILRERDPDQRWDRPDGDTPPPLTHGPRVVRSGTTVRVKLESPRPRDVHERAVDMLVITCGRKKYMQRTMASFSERVSADFRRRLILDDSGDPRYRSWLERSYPEFEVRSTTGLTGFTEAIRAAWRELYSRPGAPYIFHLEEDFTFDRDVDLRDLISILEVEPRLAQVALLRGPYYPPELEAGGIVEQNPRAYQRRRHGELDYLVHRQFFTTNPCVYRRDLLKLGWPASENSESVFTRGLVNRAMRFGLFGTGEPWVSHIGEERTMRGY